MCFQSAAQKSAAVQLACTSQKTVKNRYAAGLFARWHLIRQTAASTSPRWKAPGRAGPQSIKPSPCSGAHKRGMPVASPSGDRHYKSLPRDRGRASAGCQWHPRQGTTIYKAFPVLGGAQARDAGGIPVRGPLSIKPSPCSGARKRGMPVASPAGDRASGG